MPCTPARVWAAMQGRPSRRNDDRRRVAAGPRARRSRATAFVTATVVRAQRPTSVQAGTSRSCSPTARSRASSAACARSTACAPTRCRRSRPARPCCCASSRSRGGGEPGGGRAEDGAVDGRRIRACRAVRSRSSSSRSCPRRASLVVGDTPIAAAPRPLGAELGLDARRTSTASAPEPRPAISRSSSPRTAATSCTRCAAGSRRACRTSGSSPAPSAAPACSPSYAPTASPTSSSRASTCPPGSTSAPARPPRSRCRSSRDRRRAPRAGARPVARAVPPRRRRAARAAARGRPDLRDDRRRRREHAVASSTTARPSTSAARAARPKFAAQHAVASGPGVREVTGEAAGEIRGARPTSRRSRGGSPTSTTWSTRASRPRCS